MTTNPAVCVPPATGPDLSARHCDSGRKRSFSRAALPHCHRLRENRIII